MGFFFGLVLSSTYFVKTIAMGLEDLFVLCYRTVGAYFIAVATLTETSNNLCFIFLCGAITFSHDIARISGNFILFALASISIS